MCRRAVTLLLLAGLTAGGCGGSGGAAEPTANLDLVTPPRYVGAPPVPTPAPDRVMTARDARALRPVLARWAAAVRRGNAAAAARFFALPAIVYQPSFGAVEVRDRAVARAFTGALPCGARLVGTRAQGRYITATFTLEARAGRVCTTADAKVEVGFVFGDRTRPRRFTEWWQVPEGVDPRPQERPVVEAASTSTFAAAPTATPTATP
jgi:hypothetical protein